MYGPKFYHDLICLGEISGFLKSPKNLKKSHILTTKWMSKQVGFFFQILLPSQCLTLWLLMLHLLVDFPFGIFLWLLYKIFTSNFKMLIEDRKMKNPWIWIQTNLFPIKWIEKTFVRVKIVGQSKKIKLFFYCTWNNMKFNLLPSLQSCFFFYMIFLNFGQNLRNLTLVTWQEDWQP